MKHLLLGLFTCLVAGSVAAQDFVTRGKIEYEIKVNNRKEYADRDPRNSSYYSALPEFDVTYRELLFTWNQYIYKPGRLAPTASHRVTESSAYVNLDEKEMIVKEKSIDDYYVMKDSLRTVKWRLQHETRKIAGWECRKAIGIIHDSVYVVAFYCPEIITQGGPEFFTGLPGMILGVAIPRYNTTWFATRVELASVDESTMAPPKGKKGKVYSKPELAELLVEKYKEAGWWKDVTRDKVIENLTDYILY